jgi:1,4-alpha-glucan branching enzyme
MAPAPRVFPQVGYEGSTSSADTRPERPRKPVSERYVSIRCAVADARIYEAHIGVAIGDNSGIGTFSHFEEHILPRVKKGGYTTLQLYVALHFHD